MVTFKERCPVCNNILDEDDRCPTCTRGSIVESLPITLDSKSKHLSAIDLNIRIELTDAALRNFHDLGYGSPRATLSQYIANEIYAYLYNEGTGREGEPKIRVCLATDVGHKVNQSIKEEIKGTLQFIGVIKDYEFYTRNDFDSEKYLLILSVSKGPVTNGWYVKDKCLFVRLTKTGNNHNVYNTIQKIITLPNIENLRDKVEKQLEQWNVYLEILNRNVKSKKYEVVYNALRQLDKNKVVFYITGNDIPWSSIRNSIEWPIKLRYSRALTNLGYDEDYEGDPEIGVVWEVEPRKNSITVELYSPSLFSVLPSSGVLYYDARADQIQIKRMQEGMTILAKGRTVNPELAKFLFDISQASPITELVPLRKSEIYIREIFQNQPQMRAVRGALSARDIFLIQGPPGTGKTTIISEICYQLTRNGNRVLIASQSNLAVDNALSHLVKAPEIRAIRLGRAERVEEEGLEFLEENVVRRWLSDTRTLVANKQSYELQAIKQYQQDIDRLRDEINTIEEYLSLEQDQNEKENELEKYKKSREPLDNVIETITKILGAASEPEQYFEKISIGLDVLPAGLKREIESWVKSQAGFGQAIDVLGASLNAKDIFQKLAKFSNLSYDNLVDNIIKPLKWMLLTKKIALIDTYLEDLGRVRRAIDEKIQIPIVSRVIFDDVREFGTDLEMEITECVDVKKHLLEKQTSLSISEEVFESSIEKVFLKVNKYLDTCRWLESLIAKIPELNRVLEGTLKKEKEELEKIEKPLQSLEFEINQIHLKRSALKNKIEEWGLEPTQEELDGLREDLSITKTNYEKIKNREYRRRYIESWLERLSNLTNTDVEDLRQIYVDNANVVGVTCSAAGSRRFMEKYHGFDCVIIDEVSKAIPPEIVLPSIKGRKIILVGDHRQLPPLIEDRDLSELAEELQLSDDEKRRIMQSIFEELFESADPSLKETLTIQYRMHPQIMNAINQFYTNKLTCGITDPDRKRAHGLEELGPPFDKNHLVWIDVPLGGEYLETKIGTTYWNESETKIAISLATMIQKLWKKRLEQQLAEYPLEVGLISFYSGQTHQLRIRIDQLQNQSESVRFRVGTVDRFQGIEKDVVIASLVRNNTNNNIGFAKLPNRINVAFSRARNLLIIIGCSELFTNAGHPSARYYLEIYNQAKRDDAVRGIEWLNQLHERVST